MPYYPPATIATAAANLSGGYLAGGHGTNGNGTTVTSGAANGKGSWVPIFTTTEPLAGLDIFVGPQSSSAHRDSFDVSLDGGVTVHAENIWAQQGTAAGFWPVPLPLDVPDNADIRIRVQTTASASTRSFAVGGPIRTAGYPPLYSLIKNLTVDLANTWPSSTDVPMTDAYTELVASTSEAFDGLFLLWGHSPTGNPATQQHMLASLATGGSGSEVLQLAQRLSVNNAAPYVRPTRPVILTKAIAQSTRIAAKLTAATTTDVLRASVYGLKAA